MGMLRRRQGQCRAIFYPMSVSGRPKYRERDGHEKNTEKCDLERTDDELCACKMTLRAIRFTYLSLQVEKHSTEMRCPLLASVNLEEKGSMSRIVGFAQRRGTMHLLFAWRNVAHSRLCCVLFAVCYCCVFFFRGYDWCEQCITCFSVCLHLLYLSSPFFSLLSLRLCMCTHAWVVCKWIAESERVDSVWIGQ